MLLEKPTAQSFRLLCGGASPRLRILHHPPTHIVLTRWIVTGNSLGSAGRKILGAFFSLVGEDGGPPTYGETP
ncbi:MAG: hypothetical protein PHO46_06920 [Thermoguttaceae bacterium]|nr:hypothetical protein [Thermoguttaceae bacterium]